QQLTTIYSHLHSHPAPSTSSSLALHDALPIFCFSSGVAIDSVGNVFVADAFNNRVLEYDTPLTTDTIADRVFGQGGSFNSDSCNVGASGLCAPHSTAVRLAVDGGGYLYVHNHDTNRRTAQ